MSGGAYQFGGYQQEDAMSKTPETDAVEDSSHQCPDLNESCSQDYGRMYDLARKLETQRDRLLAVNKTLVEALERILDITRHEPLGNLNNALAEIARAALKAGKG